MNTPDNTIRVWDPLVRIGHWTLMFAFFTAYFTEDDFLTQHVWAGYVVGVVLCVRLIWGLIGTKHARFVDFVRSPAETLRYVKDLAANRAVRFVGHNPAGGAMVVALLLSISGTVFSGLVVYGLEEDAGPLAGWVSDYAAPKSPQALSSVAYGDTEEHEDEKEDDEEHEDNGFEEFWEEVHEILANVSLLLVGVHIAGVLFSSYTHSENLIRGMINGRKRRE